VRDIELKGAGQEQPEIEDIRIGSQFPSNQLISTTVYMLRDRQAQQMMNGFISQGEVIMIIFPTSLEAVAYHWLENIYKPVITRLKTQMKLTNVSMNHPTFRLCRFWAQVVSQNVRSMMLAIRPSRIYPAIC
jgi:hypothetical protein